MLLHFNRPHLSIQNFKDVELEKLTVLTGINGAGKTHLLEAIVNGSVIVGDIPRHAIARFDYENFKLDNENEQNMQAINNLKENAWASMQNVVSQIGHTLRPIVQKISSSGLTQEDDQPFWAYKGDASMDQYREAIYAAFSSHQVSGQPWSSSLINFIKSSKQPVFEINKEDFINHYRPFNYKDDFLPQSIGAVIWDYYSRSMQNALNRLQYDRGNLHYRYLDDAEFVARYGEKPWDAINRILRSFGTLDFELESPEGADVFRSFNLRLVHTKDRSLSVNFSNLSSGERILMALVSSVYRYASERYFPELLLLDELDATLHPSMMRNMLDVVQNTFIARGTNVILVTHSPTTVALSKENSIVIMRKSGEDRFEKASPTRALSILTEGFATLDEGVVLYNQLAGNQLSVVSEGRNRRLIKKACELYGENRVHL